MIFLANFILVDLFDDLPFLDLSVLAALAADHVTLLANFALVDFFDNFPFVISEWIVKIMQ